MKRVQRKVIEFQNVSKSVTELKRFSKSFREVVPKRNSEDKFHRGFKEFERVSEIF